MFTSVQLCPLGKEMALYPLIGQIQVPSWPLALAHPAKRFSGVQLLLSESDP